METVYKITCLKNNKFYIGSTYLYDVRLNVHFGRISWDCIYDYMISEPNVIFKEDLNKYGFDNFKFEKICESEDKIEISRLESKIIRENSKNPLLYNITLGASGRRVFYESDIIFIRKLYDSKKMHINEAYNLYYKNIVTHRAFKKV